MALARSTSYAQDIRRALNGIILVHKPPRLTTRQLILEFKYLISDALNEYKPRELSSRLVITGDIDEKKELIQTPNLADHPLVVGPRYLPWELSIGTPKPSLEFRSSGLVPLLLGSACGFLQRGLSGARMVNVYEITGKFGFITDTFFYDGKIQDKSTFKHIRPGKFDSVLTRIESNQQERLFDAANVSHDSDEAYELAKSWPSRPAKSAKWPVIYRLRCLHLKLPDFKIEVTCCNESQYFLAQLVHEIGLMLKSGAYTENIRRVKYGPFSIDECLTIADWNIQSILDNISIHEKRRDEILEIIKFHRTAMSIRSKFEHEVKS